MKKFPKTMLFIVTLLFLSTFVTPALAQSEEPAAQPPADAAQLAALLDDFFAEKLVEHHVPGAVFVLVQDGEIFFSAGYGYANLEEQIPYDPQETIIRGGSTIKMITAVAVMQLAEQGRVDVHADINQYLTTFQLPDTYSEPVTLHHLLHHTSGIDSKFSNTRVDRVDELEPLGSYLARELPPRVAPPGEYRNYNDFGIALAGLVVEEVSGIPFDQYVAENIFVPLGMDSSWMIVPEEQVHRLANGYMEVDGRFEANLSGNYLLNTGPGAAYNTTAHDLAQFMLLYLENGRVNGRQLLQPETVQELQRTQFRHAPQMPGMAYAMDELFVNGQRLLAKSGGAPGTNNRMVLIPEANIGFFVSYNRYGGRLHSDLTSLLMDTYFPDSSQPLADPAQIMPAEALAAYTGYYREMIGYSATTFEKISTLANQIQVTANDDGTLNLFGGQLVPVQDDLFRWADGGSYVAAGQDSEGQDYLYVARTAYQRIPWYETLPVQGGLLLLSLLLFITGIASWFWARRSTGHVLVRGLPPLIGLANIFFLAGFVIYFLNLTGGGEPPWMIEYGIPLPLAILLAIPLATLALTGVMLGTTAVGLWRRTIPARIVLSNSLVLIGVTAFTFFLSTWNLLGYHS